ncbi:MAG: NADH-ubiquinone oxidoreductase-F iron-sulfur binding region domain-containing protein [Motiliproteus sp.]
MSVRVFIPQDTTALALGADRLVMQLQALTQGMDEAPHIVRNGSRGLFWLEPLLEVETTAGRVAYGPVRAQDVESLLAAGMLDGDQTHPLCQGLTEEIPYLKNQQRLTFARAGIADPLSIEDYSNQGGFKGLQKALTLSPQGIVDEVKRSGLRGRGGAAFPTGIKWQTVLDAEGADSNPQKYIVCNADEGDSGTFADRLVMEADPYMLIEGMIIAGLAVGASQGYIYLRSEYPQAQVMLEQAIAKAESAGYLGDAISGSDHCFRLEVRLGAGAYICGEETSLLESLEGKRGLVRAKPPLPALVGLFGQPTVVNNVLSLAAIPYILAEGAQSYADFGMGRSRGTLAFQLAGNIERGGLVELAFGATLKQLLQDYGNGSASGRPIHAVQVGGPLGAYLPESQWHTPLDYEAFAEIGAVLGHGGIVVFDDSVDMAQQARFAMEFCVAESCGKCTPCRIGSTRGVEVIDRLIQGHNPEADLELLEDLCDTMEDGSLCAMGGMTPNPVRSAVNLFPEHFSALAETVSTAEKASSGGNDHA